MRLAPALLLLALLGALGASCQAGAPYPFPWFTEHFQLGQLALPSGVGLQVEPDPDTGMAGQFIVLSNSSPTILFVIGENYSSDPPVYEDISVQLPSGTGPINKVAAGVAFKWKLGLTGPNSGPVYTWRLEDNHHHYDSVWLFAGLYNRIASDSGTVLNLKPRNEYGGYRPTNAKAPYPQNAALGLIYGTQELRIPLTVSYTLNEAYHSPESGIFPDHVSTGTVVACSIYGAALVMFVLRLAWQHRRGGPQREIPRQ